MANPETRTFWLVMYKPRRSKRWYYETYSGSNEAAEFDTLDSAERHKCVLRDDYGYRAKVVQVTQSTFYKDVE